MRFTAAFFALALAAGPALATDVPGTKDRANLGGGAPTGGGSQPTGGASLATEQGGGSGGVLDVRAQGQKAVKRWEVSATLEEHAMVIQQDLGGDAPNKWITAAYLYGRFDVTPHNRLSVRLGAYTHYVVDQSDSPVRLTDLSLTYTRTQPLPKEFTLRGSFSLTAPTGYYSQQVCNVITVPSLSLGASKKLGHFSFDARVFGTVSIVRTAECTGPHGDQAGGSPNQLGSIGGFLDAEYSMPFHEPLTVGVDAYTGYNWYYNVAGSPPSCASFGYPNGSNCPGPSVDPVYGTSQPVQQSYGYEAYLRYNFPEWRGLKSDLMFAYANGDPTLGFNSVLHDGVSHYYSVFWRHTSEFYGALSARY